MLQIDCNNLYFYVFCLKSMLQTDCDNSYFYVACFMLLIDCGNLYLFFVQYLKGYCPSFSSKFNWKETIFTVCIVLNMYNISANTKESILSKIRVKINPCFYCLWMKKKNHVFQAPLFIRLLWPCLEICS